MASDVFLKVKGIPGDSQVDGHKKEIEILSWSIGSSLPVGARTSAGSGAAGTSMHSDLSIMKSLDESSNALADANWTGKTIPEMILFVQRAGDKTGKKVDYYKLTLTQVLVSSYQLSGSPGSVPTESLSFNSATKKQEYFATGVAGEGSGWKDVGWNIAEEKKL